MNKAPFSNCTFLLAGMHLAAGPAVAAAQPELVAGTGAGLAGVGQATAAACGHKQAWRRYRVRTKLQAGPRVQYWRDECLKHIGDSAPCCALGAGSGERSRSETQRLGKQHMDRAQMDGVLCPVQYFH